MALGGPPRGPEFINARRLAGLACIGVGCLLAIIDALDQRFELSPVILVILMAAGFGMFGLSFTFPSIPGGPK